MAAAKPKVKSPVAPKQSQVEFPSADGAKLGRCRAPKCANEVGPKSTICSTHRALLARKRDRALFLYIKGTDEGKSLIDKATKKGVVRHLGL